MNIENLPKSVFFRDVQNVGQPVSMGRELHGDLWPMSWAKDGRMYAGVGDGTGFSLEKPCHVLPMSFTVDPASARFEGEDLAPQYFAPMGRTWIDERPNFKPTGMLALDNSLYFLVTNTEPNWAKGPCKDLRLFLSPDLGKTWTQRVLFPYKFMAPTFLQAGRNGEDFTDEYAYLYSPKYNWYEEDELFLARVRRDRIASPEAYEYFCGRTDGQTVKWCRDVDDMRPVFVCATHYVQQCEVVYIKALKRYIMVQWKMGTREYNRQNDHYPELYMLEAPAPWGPWSIFHHNKRWGLHAQDYRYCGRIPACLISPDGLEFYLQYSGWSPVMDPTRTPYNFTVQRMRLTT